MVTRHIQILFVGLIAMSALEHASFQATQAEAIDRAARLAKSSRPTLKATASPFNRPPKDATQASAVSTKPATKPATKASGASGHRLSSPRMGS
jgi:hypothetical protein